tara:strand:+ start:1980 stop:2189 length:210 start_codon:yes stop_codon:yes gene_type:complete
MAERRTDMGFWAKFIKFITPPPPVKKVDEVKKAKIVKKAIKEATVVLPEFVKTPVKKPKAKKVKVKKKK